jgi:hypothetical protein
MFNYTFYYFSTSFALTMPRIYIMFRYIQPFMINYYPFMGLLLNLLLNLVVWYLGGFRINL